jgi:hypothetical protein
MDKQELDQELDWVWGEEMLTTAEDAYKELLGMGNVNPWFVLGALASLRGRIDKGERTTYLYEDIRNQFEAL